MTERLDIIIFGATGYTGKVAVEECVALAKEKGGLTWGIAGRNQGKLAEVIADVEKKTGESLKDVKIVIANVDDEKSLKDMASMCKVLVNCVGPYRHWGEQAVKACIESGTHHVDVSGEPQYMEKMQLMYHKQAEEKGVYIVSACGFDSIPAEIGSLFFSKQFDGEPNAVETYLTSSNKNRSKGAGIHYGTWESAVYGLAHANELRPLRRQLFPHRLPSMSPKLQSRGAVFRSPVGRGWCLPFLGSDLSVMRRSQHYFHEKKGQRPLQIQCYFTLPSLIAVLGVMFVASIFFVLTKFGWGRKLLLSYPKLFSFGFVSHEGPTEESRKETKFAITFVGEGWAEKKADGNQHTSAPDTRVVTKVSGFDPGYGFTTRCLLLCATTIMSEANKMPGKGGVYPPGAAFAETSLMSKLQSHGLTMEVVEKKKID
ncbi:saccharopine dehydrogenase-like oxidoreductase [Cloeon dipterum]|uniref:saccharopine dehydrogenase-like oxidoreductase n=1 Tax=Cloeon dipterum TaxID=197152 RepID=UPI00322012D6